MSFDKYIHLCNPSLCHVIQHHDSRSAMFPYSPVQSSLLPLPEANTLLLFHTCMMAIHVFVCINNSFLFFFLVSSISILLHCVNIPQFIHSFIDGHLSFIQLLANMSNLAMNILIQIFLWTYFQTLVKILLFKCWVIMQ